MNSKNKEKSVKAVSYSELAKIIGGDKTNKDLGDKMDSTSGLGSGASNTERSSVQIKSSAASQKVKK